VYDSSAASAMGLNRDQVCVMIHCGSRGLGHQTCTDHVRPMEKAMALCAAIKVGPLPASAGARGHRA
jgi:RNA-splicing ligase RtcB